MENKRKTMKKILSIGLASTMLLSAAETVSAQEAEDTGTVQENLFIQNFANAEGENSHPTMRYWLSVAADPEKVYEEICALAEAGYGGVEIIPFASNATRADGSVVGENDAYAWGTEHWNSLLKSAMQAAVDSGIKLDYAISFAWPISAPEIETTADDAAEVSIFITKSQETLAAGTQTCAVSNIGLEPYGWMGEMREAELKENSRLLSATLAKVGEDETTFEDIIDVSSLVQEDAESPSGYSVTCEVPDDGQYVLIGNWQSPTESTKGGNYVIDHYGEAGARAVIDYWINDVIPAVGEDLFREASRSIFCDSLEQSGNWTARLADIFQSRKGYDIRPYISILTGSYSLSDSEKNDAILRDYYDVLTYCFNENHLKPIKEFCNSYDLTLRYQTAYGKTLELSSTAMNVDIPEGEAMMIRFPIDNTRAQAGAVHTSGKTLYTAELQAEMGKTYSQTWDDFLYVLQRQWAGGINNFTMHGASYSGAFSGEDADPSNGYLDGIEWPGYEGFGRTSYSNNWNRMPSWEHISDYIEYVSRMNYVLQQGVADVDIAVYRNEYNDNIMETDRNYIYKDGGLERAGYTYDFVGPANLALETSTVEDGTLCPDGPSYKAMIIQFQEYMPTETAERILGYAQAGLPVVIIGDTPDTTGTYGESNEKLLEAMASLLELENVTQVNGYEEVIAALQNLNVEPDAQFTQEEDVLSVHRKDEDADFYYLYNYGGKGMPSPFGVVTEDLYTDITPVDYEVSFLGEGVPYLVDAWTGEITPVSEYSRDGDRITVNVTLDANESKVLAFASPEWGNADAAVYATSSEGGETFYKDGALMFRSTVSGSYKVDLNDGQTAEVQVENVKDPVELTTWNLSVKDYCPGETPLDTVYNVIEVGETQLVSWTEIDAVKDAAGIGTYTATFTLPADWDEKDGAILDLGRVQDSFRVTVNGIAQENGNRCTSKMDIGSSLKAGSNTITVEVATTLANKMISLYADDERTPDDYGLLGNDGVVTITPYRTAEVPVA